MFHPHGQIKKLDIFQKGRFRKMEIVLHMLNAAFKKKKHIYYIASRTELKLVSEK